MGKKKKNKKAKQDNMLQLEGGAPAEKSGSGFKTLLWFILLLNLLALGAFVYSKFVRLQSLEKELKRAKRQTVRAREQLRDLAAAARTIKTNRFDSISDPGTTILKLADAMGLGDKVKARKAVQKVWKDGTYEEVTVQIQIRQKEGFAFGALVTFMQEIERRNPKLLIKSVNFGKREKVPDPKDPHPELGEPDLWRPSGSFMTVRTFRLKD